MCKCIYMYIFFIHSSVDGHLGCFHILAIVNNASMNIQVYISFQTSVFIYLGGKNRSELARLYDSFIFNFFRNYHTVFHSSCTSVYSRPQCMKSLHSTFLPWMYVSVFMPVPHCFNYCCLVV